MELSIELALARDPSADRRILPVLLETVEGGSDAGIYRPGRVDRDYSILARALGAAEGGVLTP